MKNLIIILTLIFISGTINVRDLKDDNKRYKNDFDKRCSKIVNKTKYCARTWFANGDLNG